MNFRSPILLRQARDQSCVHCGADDGTIVAAHSNMPEHGKGQSIKANDCFIAHLCGNCHRWLDQGSGMDPTGLYSDSREDKREMFRRAMDRTTLRLWQNKRIKVA